MASVKRGFQEINGNSVPYTVLVRKNGAVHLLRAGNETWHWKKAPTVPSLAEFETWLEVAIGLAICTTPVKEKTMKDTVKATKEAIEAGRGQTKDYKMEENKVVGVIRGHSRTGERITALLFNNETVQLKRLGVHTFHKGGRFPMASFLQGHGMTDYQLTGR